MIIQLKISQGGEKYFAVHQRSGVNSQMNTVLENIEFTLRVLTTRYLGNETMF